MILFFEMAATQLQRLEKLPILLGYCGGGPHFAVILGQMAAYSAARRTQRVLDDTAPRRQSSMDPSPDYKKAKITQHTVHNRHWPHNGTPVLSQQLQKYKIT